MAALLDYDTLPAHSNLRREFADGILKITATPEEPGPLVRRAALLGAAFAAAIIFLLVMLIGFAVFGSMYESNRRNLSWGLSLVLLIAFVVLCTALFALLWRIQYSIRLDAAQNALKQATILAASRGRLIVETSGPRGTASHDWKNTVRSIRIARDCLQIELNDGQEFQLLNGRDNVELRWVARAIDRAIQ